MKLLKISSFFFFLSLFIVVSVDAECDHPESVEKVRIYFANGMSNSHDDAQKSADRLRKTLGMEERDFGLSYNFSENWFTQLIQVYGQRKRESDKFWFWLRQPDQAPQWFRDAYAQKIKEFKNFVTSDIDLLNHINKYLVDLSSGKKVLIVAHSQGNFYANNAYRYIKKWYPKYANSIGIISVATPSNTVEGSFPAIDLVYTNNPEDFIINMVRRLYPDTLPGNVPPYNNPNSLIDHEFVATYFAPESIGGYRLRIVNQIINRINSLQVPEKSYECKNPEEVPVSIVTQAASSVSSTSARLNAYVASGKQVDAICIKRRGELELPTCEQRRYALDTSGRFNGGDQIYCTYSGLRQDTIYHFRFCARQGDRISDGGEYLFRTSIRCGTPLEADGGSEGLSVSYGMGETSGYATVDFQAYNIPDWLEIKQGGKIIYTTDGYVSGHYSQDVYHNASKGQVWQVSVYGNADSGTAWKLNISCPSD